MTEIVYCSERQPEEMDGDHDWGETFLSWEGDPNVINGERSWKTRVCRLCGEEEHWA